MDFWTRCKLFIWRGLILQKKASGFKLFEVFLPVEEKNFLEFIKDNLEIKTRSQLYQDFLPLFIFGMDHKGYFVEVGVGNGISNSNTFLLEKSFYWNGILVEPNSTFHTSIQSYRDAKLFKCAAGSRDGKEIFLNGTLDGEYSYVTNEFVGLSSRREPAFIDKVTMFSLNTILDQASAPQRIDFLSIDVEGFEIDVLHGIDFGKWKIQLICVEHNYNQSKKSQIHSILQEQGYLQILKYASQFDSFYVLPALKESFL